MRRPHIARAMTNRWISDVSRRSEAVRRSPAGSREELGRERRSDASTSVSWGLDGVSDRAFESRTTRLVPTNRARGAGVESLRAHHAYLTGLGRDFDLEAFLCHMASGLGAAIGVEHALAFGRVQLHGV